MKAWLSNAWNVVLLLSLISLAGGTLTYRHLYRDAEQALSSLQGEVKQQNETARGKLAVLTAERDAKQAELEKAAAEQEKRDADTKAEIARLGDELRNRPVRVRIIAAGGGGRGGASGGAAPAAGDSAADAGTSDGLLAPENSRRLTEAIVDIELLSAAYASCRSRLLGN